ncbi:hypothetical protein ACM1TL_13175 [Lysinibacillus capsici]|uniref:hypothetical protein n=1 Tax=Lysinibacillus TaxID=400634 RepID=UPI002161D2E5|nr:MULTISPECIES: hypothetical protein [Lysinibacillus]MCS1393281.1 hypothetical protein [Lysinibacillus boronitolerans]UNT56498.1 hypothetical protein ICJ70_05380 [Lysinibacillus capsici]WBF57625.1 hypothetical protein HXV90_18250 [Lysinibacillus sp. JK80]
MGTSKRKLNKEIKKMLQDVPVEKINDKTPDVTKKIITLKRINTEFLDEATLNKCISIISNQFEVLSKEGFNGITQQEIKNDPITTEQFVNHILDLIDNEDNLFADKALLERSFKITMTNFLKNEDLVLTSFIEKLLFNVVKQILIGELHDTLKEVYDELNYDDIELMVNNVSNQIIDNETQRKIDQYIAKDLEFSEVLKSVVEAAKNVTFGEF